MIQETTKVSISKAILGLAGKNEHEVMMKVGGHRSKSFSVKVVGIEKDIITVVAHIEGEQQPMEGRTYHLKKGDSLDFSHVFNFEIAGNINPDHIFPLNIITDQGMKYFLQKTKQEKLILTK
jgi:hypothetical protein